MGYLKLKLPWPPSINHYYEPQRRGTYVGVGLSKKAKDFRKDAIADIWAQLGNRMPTPTTRRLSVHLFYCAPDRSARDLDNFAKGVLDAMTHAKVYKDDSQIDRKLSVRGPICKPGFVVVKLRALPHVQQLTFDLGDETAAPF